MNTTNLAQQLAVIETTSGLDLLVDYVSWIEFDGLPVVVTKSGKRKSVLKNTNAFTKCFPLIRYTPQSAKPDYPLA